MLRTMLTYKITVLCIVLLFAAVPLSATLPTQTTNFASPAYWGMAHSGGAIADITNAYWLNPALCQYDAPYSISLNEAFLPGMDIYISELSGHYRVRPSHVLSSGFNFENYGNFEARDIEGTLQGEFTASQYQYFFGYAYQVSPHFAAGMQMVLHGNRIAESRETRAFLRYGFSYTFGKRDNMLAFSGITNGLDNRWRASISHELEYLPLRLNIDFRWYGDDWDPASFRNSETDAFEFDTAARYFAEKLTFGTYILAGPNLRIMAGLDLARLNLQSNSFGFSTIISGLAFGGQYRVKQIEINLGLYHYANLTTMTALGISYIGK
ncbi:MAG: hypothetical protein KAT14_04780 [Candidatus Marinimicrobia bacterium]|nr:hypothetical protein [Candidatus Neomarinimicrobiota bacterium]